jgi:hypothetical protein
MRGRTIRYMRETIALKVADEIWIATALLHREHPDRVDFTVKEIEERAIRERAAGEVRKGLYPHASLHCVANVKANPATHRMLFATAKSRRRLFRDGDPFHPTRRNGRNVPEREAVPPRYRYLLDWYERGATVPVPGAEDPLLALAGSGRELWHEEPPDDYIRRLREQW